MVKSIFDFYVNKHFHLTLSLVLFYFFQADTQEFTIDYIYAVFLFFAGMVAYNVHDLPRDEPIKLDITNKVILGISFCGALVSFLYLPVMIWMYIIPIVMVTFLYTYPVFSNHRKLRDLPYIKIFILSFVLTYMVVFIPSVLNGANTLVLLLMFLSRFIFFFTLCLLFDMRDRKKDVLHGLKSLATTLSYSLLKKIGLGAVIMVLVLEVYMANHFIIDPENMVAMTIASLGIILFFRTISPVPRTTLFSFLCDGIIALPYLVMILCF